MITLTKIELAEIDHYFEKRQRDVVEPAKVKEWRDQKEGEQMMVREVKRFDKEFNYYIKRDL